MLLEERKMKLVPLKSPGPVKPDAVGYIYGADGGSLNVLITEGADAATTISRELDRLKPEIRESLKVIGNTVTVPRQLLAVRKDLDEKMVKEIKNILTAMDKTSEGQGVLKRQQNTNKFDEIPPKSVEQLKKIEKFVFSSLGKEVDSW
jgi:ABC-type phosphate/phosphonate transport system substrate-binding protein